MDTRQFLEHVLPRHGPYCITAGPEKPWYAYAAEDIDDAVRISLDKDTNEGLNVWFAIGALIKAEVYDEAKDCMRVSRAGSNIRAVRSYTMDIDAGDRRAYPTTKDALAALLQFCEIVGLPEPTVVQSGNGLHVYWTLTEEVPEAEWEAHGKVLAELAAHHGLKIDAARTNDSSSVLRVVGTHNYKAGYGAPVVSALLVGTDTPTAAFHALLQLSEATPIQAAAPYIKPVQDEFGSNVNRYEPNSVDPAKVYNNCQLFRFVADPANQAQGKEAIPEPAWHDMMMIAAHCVDGRTIAHNISKHDPRYSKVNVDRLYDRLQNYGPATCARISEDFEKWGDKYACMGCPSRGKITSPVVVARFIKELPPPVVAIKTKHGVREEVAPDLPDDFVRTEFGIAIKTANTRTGAPDTIPFCPDMYPSRIEYNSKTNESKGRWWMVKLPHRDWFEVDIPNCGSNSLRTVLADRGIEIYDHHTNFMANFMTAYVKKLRAERPSEGTYNKFGWRDNFTSFALGDTLYRRDGSQEFIRMSKDLLDSIEQGVSTVGDIDVWRKAISIYNREGYEAYRCFFYSTFASPLFHMSEEVATTVAATGVGGIGKSTLLDAAAAVWGDPNPLVIRGGTQGATINAIEGLADCMNNLPMMLDEITDRDGKDVSSFIFTFSGGKGKKRSKASGGVRADKATWSSICMFNGNTEQYVAMAAAVRDSDPHMMRLIELNFQGGTTISKDDGTLTRQLVRENYGHAGHLYVEYITQHYVAIKARVKAYITEIDKRVKAESKERFWTAWIASCQVAAEIASMLGLLPDWPIESDMEWLYEQVGELRIRTSDAGSSPQDTMSEFLDREIPRTLGLDAQSATNIAHMSHEPKGGLTVRREADATPPVSFVSRNAFRDYCVERGANMERLIRTLQAQGFVRSVNLRKVLGAGTPYAAGVVRCIEVDLAKLGKI